MKINFTFLIVVTCMLALAGTFVTRPVVRVREQTIQVRAQKERVASSDDAPQPAPASDPDDDILPLPETPATEQFVPTSIKDFKIANPAEGISLIDAPKANSQGNAALTFNMILPQGRQGLQPDLPIQYSSDNGSTWLGTGWNLSLPAVTIDTRWGVPRYDTVLETEMYQLSGQQLGPVNNRSALVPRTAEKRFHLRVEGEFSKIIRHGSNPLNYWWEVTEKNGNRSWYGGTPSGGVVPGAVLKDAQNNIAYWALVETTDLNGNYVHYVYANVSDAGVAGSTFMGQQLYPSQIFYTGFGTTDGPYEVAFIRDRQLGETERKDVTIDGRLGLKLVSTDLLRKVNISFSGKIIRSYDLEYAEGAFYKQLLQSISELDSAGAVFYTHRFSYFDDVNKQNYTPADSIVQWNIPGDGIQGNEPIDIIGFTPEATAINSSKASGGGFSIGVTVGSTVGGEWSKKVSVGGFFSYNTDNQEGMTSLIDINGDGLPDKVFKNNGALYYRPNLGGVVRGFGDSRPITGVTDISASSSTTIGGGAQVIPYKAYVGYEHDETNTSTTVYFADFNGDGLMDIASNGQVYFNHLNAQGDPEFTTSSTPTPNPILSGNVDSSFLVKDTALQTEQENMFPLQDVVKMWQAPYTGTVTITAPVQLIQHPNDTGVAFKDNDGVRASIQQSGTVLWSTMIGPTDYTTKTPAGVASLAVTQGQHIYFRLQSNYNGQDDQVNWDPIIDYTTPTAATSDHKLSSHYQASADFILDNQGAVGMGKAGSITIDGTFNKSLTTDTVSLEVVLLRNSVYTTLFQRDCTPAESDSGPLVIGTEAVDTSDQLFFLIRSKSYIDRSALLWQPHYAYTTFTDGTAVTGTDGKPTLEGYPVPDNSNYNDRVIAVIPYVPTATGPVVILPKITGGGSGTLWLTIKGNDTIYAHRQIAVNGGTLSTAPDSIRFTRQANDTLYIEYATDTLAFAQSLPPPAVTIYRDSTVISSGVPTDSLLLDTVVAANLYANPDVKYLGPLFRGWGQFALKGNQANIPIAEDSLNLNALSSYPSDPSNYTDSASVTNLQDPSKTYFVTMYADEQKMQWSGYDTSVFIRPAEMSSSRVGMHDVAVDSTTAGGTAGSVNKQIKTVTDSYIGGAFAGPFGASGGTSSSTATTGLDMMDINGDQYPDIVNGSSIQYTLPGGGLGTQVIPQQIGTTTDVGSATGGTLGFDPIRSNPYNNPKRDAGASENTAKHSIGLSAGVESNQNSSVVSWADVNGDGLPDRITDSARVELNLGYTFGPPEVWGLNGIDAGNSLSFGGGVGLNIDGGSFEGGYGISRTIAANSFGLNDVNGDGLPDQLILGSDSVLRVRLNTGNGFGPPITWGPFNEVTVNSSTGEAFNTAVTGVIPIPIIFLKICINPGGNGGWGVSRTNDAVMDLDGDGYADRLHSVNDGDLSASFSTIGRTNLLSTIKGPLGSLTTLDYYRVGNTYGMPQSKWALKSTTVFDGVKGDGVDTIRHQFSYAGGYLDRREREFYGFDTVITYDLNTANQNKVYRSHVQLFLNNSYYSRGLLAGEWLLDSAGNKYTQTNYQYNLRLVQDSVQFPALQEVQKLYYEGAATAGVSTVIQYDYDTLGNITKISDAGDGSQGDLLLTTISYNYLNSVYVESVPSSVIVTTAAGVKRKRTTTVSPTGDLLSVTQWLDDNTPATTTITYDNYGNFATITQPANYKGQRMSYTYAYDSIVNTYNTKITDAFGYTTTKSYDYRFGILTGMVNRNNEQTRYTVDNHGRITTFTGPVEMAAGLPYTIAMSYYPDSTISYAETQHYDPEYKSNIRLVNFVDGLDRSIQVKKQIALFQGKNQADNVEMAVSGKVLYDAFGREATTYYPVPEAIGVNTDAYNAMAGSIESTVSYDVLDRTLKTVLADGATGTRAYSTSGGMFLTTSTDALGLKVETQVDVRERKRSTKEYGTNGAITTSFGYDALSELMSATDNNGNVFLATYDNMGRKVTAQHPDGGLTTLKYDLAGNVLKKITAEIYKEMPDSGAIQYQYDYNRLTDIDYPRYYQNKVKYIYGAPGTGSKAGRVTLLEDGSGGEQFFYGLQGAVNKIIRTILISPVFATTFVSQQEYDTWGRIKTLTYPDGEAVTYHYNKAGGLLSMDGVKQGSNYNYVEQAGYDLFEERTYLRYGNGTENTYAYDSLRRRLVQMQALSPAGGAILNNAYTYDAESNVLSSINNVQSQSGQPGGYSSQSYLYDNLYRLDSASGQYKGSSATSTYGVRLAYDNLYNISHKTMRGAVNGQSYDNGYTYSKTAPHEAVQVGSNTYTFDANGNQLGDGDAENYYDEENRPMANIQKGVLSQYSYDAEGDMVIRSSGDLQSIWVNGAPAGTVQHTNNYSAYVSPYLVSRINTFTKNFYIDDQRIATKLGHGTFVNISFPQSGLSAGDVDYVARAAAMTQNQAAFYAAQGVSPGPPTDKNYYAEPQNSGIPAPVFVDSTANATPSGWPADTTAPPNGPPVYLPPVPSNDSVQAGYGFQDAGQLYESDQYFFHYDLTGSTTYVTDVNGSVVQHVEYSPAGETFVEEHAGSFVMPYLFHAKERDDETGDYAYGARFYDPSSSQWLTVQDALGSDYPLDLSGYGSLWDTDDGDNGAQSSPYMNPGLVVGDVLDAFDNARNGRGKTADPRDVKDQAKRSREPFSRKWQERFARWFPDYHEMPDAPEGFHPNMGYLLKGLRRGRLPSIDVIDRQSISDIDIDDRESIGSDMDRESISAMESIVSVRSSVSESIRRRSSTFLGMSHYVNGVRRNSLSSVFNASRRRLPSLESVRRRSSIGSVVRLHQMRPRSGSPSQGGNGAK